MNHKRWSTSAFLIWFGGTLRRNLAEYLFLLPGDVASGRVVRNKKEMEEPDMYGLARFHFLSRSWMESNGLNENWSGQESALDRVGLGRSHFEKIRLYRMRGRLRKSHQAKHELQLLYSSTTSLLRIKQAKKTHRVFRKTGMLPVISPSPQCFLHKLYAFQRHCINIFYSWRVSRAINAKISR